VPVSKKQVAGGLGLLAIVLFWFAIAGPLSAGVVVVVIVLAVVILNRARRKAAETSSDAQTSKGPRSPPAAKP